MSTGWVSLLYNLNSEMQDKLGCPLQQFPGLQSMNSEVSPLRAGVLMDMINWTGVDKKVYRQVGMMERMTMQLCKYVSS